MSAITPASSAAGAGAHAASRFRWMQWALLGLLGSLAAHAASGQDRSSDAITWSRTLALTDGRVFVTDGAITLDAALVAERERPSDAAAPAAAPIIERYLAAELPDEFPIGALARGARPQTYEAPTGITLAAKYVDYLRATLPTGSLRLRMKGNLDPVVILSDGKAVGVVMPLAR